MRFPSVLLMGLLGLLLLLPAGSQADAVNYDFTLIADTSGLFAQVGVDVSLNSTGSVGFSGSMKDGVGGIFTGNGGSITTIAVTRANSPLAFGFDGLAINNNGTVSFPSLLKGGGAGVFAGNGGPITTIADSSNGIVAVGEQLSINNPGTVAFLASTSQSGGLFIGNGGPITNLYNTYTGPFISFTSPTINDHGTVAFAGEMGTTSGIFTGTGTPTVTTIFQGSLGNPDVIPDINNNGTVAFGARLGATEGIFTGNGGPITTVADTSGPFTGFPGVGPVINDNGEVVFLATTAGVESAFLTGQIQRLIKSSKQVTRCLEAL